MTFLASILGVSNDEDIIHVYDNTQTIAMAKEQYGFCE